LYNLTKRIAKNPYIMTVMARRFRILGNSFQKLTIVKRISASASYLSSMKTKILKILNDKIGYR